MENYQFIKQIGHGSYGEVWLVKCSRTRRRHVLKRIDLHQASKREQRAAYLEAKLLSTIKHPNIVNYLDSFHNSFGSLFIVMCYCECGDLYSFIRNQNGAHFEEKQIVHWFVQICLALKYLHDKNILHRNLKTKNIFLTKNKIIKVGNLGISKVLSISNEMTLTTIEAPCYISPEVFAGEPHDEKSDVWALGCCVYEMAALKPPYVIQDIYSATQKKIKKKLSPIPDIYFVDLYEIICSMLDMNSENRPSITQLLLNEYVRRYILLILQDNCKSPDSESSHGSPMDRSKSNSDLSLAVIPKDTSCGIPRSKSTCFLSRNAIKIPKTPSNFTKDKTAKSIVTTVPDVNGNGDGNDNSQHGRNAHAHRKAEQKSSKVNCDKNKGLPGNDESIKNAMKLQLNVISNGDNFLPTNLKNFEMNAISKKQKMKGEISFQILNSLAYTLYSARPENLDYSNVSCNNEHSDSESMFIKSHQFYSFVNGHSEKHLPRKAVKTVVTYEKDKAKGQYENNVCSLPEIKCEPKNDRVTKSSGDRHNLPHLK